MQNQAQPTQAEFLPKDTLDSLIDALMADGYQVVGPTIDQGAIVYDEIHSASDLPRGWTDRQQAGQYRLERREDEAYFGYVVGPHSWKRFLFPAFATVATADRTGTGWEMRTPDADPRATPFWASGHARSPRSRCRTARSCTGLMLIRFIKSGGKRL